MQLALSLFECLITFDENGPPPGYLGSAWRGAFGQSLKKSVCVVRDTRCPDCLLYRSCVYPYVFETPPPPDTQKMRLYEAAPHPFVLRVNPQAGNAPYRLGLVLIGKAIPHLPYFVHAFGLVGKAGLGRGRSRFRLDEVLQATSLDGDDWESIYRPGQPLRTLPPVAMTVPTLPEWIDIHIETPLRLRREEHLVTPANFQFADLFKPLLRRISMLSYFHAGTPLQADFAGLGESALSVSLWKPKLRWYDWSRYSSRQNTKMEMGGMIGQFRLRGAEIEPFWPYLWLGQWTHAGKGATMGLGRYRILPASLPDSPEPSPEPHTGLTEL